jgi:hypothetical protein
MGTRIYKALTKKDPARVVCELASLRWGCSEFEGIPLGWSVEKSGMWDPTQASATRADAPFASAGLASLHRKQNKNFKKNRAKLN